MKNSILFLLFLNILTVAPTCRCNECIIDYHFEIPIDVTPAEHTFQVGDTLFISLEYDMDNLINLETNEMVSVFDLEPNLLNGILYNF